MEEITAKFADDFSQIEAFISHIGIDKSPNTVESYKSDLHLLLKFLIASNVHFTRASSKEISQYFTQYITKDRHNFIKIIEATTLRRKIACFRLFFQYLVEQNLMQENPISQIENPKKSINIPFYLSEEETSQMFEYTAKLNTKEGIRTNAILHVLYSCGLRVSEAITLKMENILTAGSSINKKTIIFGKGGKERLIFFDRPTQKALQKYLLARGEFKPSSKNKFVFCTNSNKGHITREAVFLALQKVAYHANLPEQVSPHKLRHSFATHVYQKGMDLRMLQVLLGHSDISTTEIYTHIKADEIKETLEKFHPLFKK